jgi:hypothetical protein
MCLITNHSNTTAILLFAQSEEKESSTKPIASSLKQNVLLWKKMNAKVLKTIQKTKIPYFISNETNQVGSNFGEKITHSIAVIFAKGYGKVIVVGNDCIELKTQHLLSAKLELQLNDWVIGADYSGGAYLIGVTKSKFLAEPFVNIPWQTKGVFKALKVLFKTQVVAYLPCLNDCNNAIDFKRATYKLSFSDTFRKTLLSFLQTIKIQYHFDTLFIYFYYYGLNFNKGSPLNGKTSV